MGNKKSNLIKKITLDMPLNQEFEMAAEKTVGDFLKNIGILPGVPFVHKGIDYYLDSYNGSAKFDRIAFQVNNCGENNYPKYIQLFSDKEDNFYQFIQYAQYLDGTYVYEDLVDWKKVKHYETFEPEWLK